MGIFSRSKVAEAPSEPAAGDEVVAHVPRKKALLPVFACGSGLFADGYINNVRTPGICARPFWVMFAWA